MPIHVVKSLYRPRFQAAIKEAFESGEIVLPPDMNEKEFWFLFYKAYRKEWSVRIEERYEHGKGVMLYLARYLKGGPLNPNQLQKVTSKEVVFQYKDHRDGRYKPLKLHIDELVQRLLQHVPVRGLHTVRSYGLYASASKSRGVGHLPQLRTLSDCDEGSGQNLVDLIRSCQTCGMAMCHAYLRWPLREKEISLIRRAREMLVQQSDQADQINECVGTFSGYG